MTEHEFMGNVAFFILIVFTLTLVGAMYYDQKKQKEKKN